MLNVTTGICDPYTYQLPQGRPNHTCRGENIWADVGRSSRMFCSSGLHCPTTTEELTCDSGRICRLGFTSEQRCFKLVSCNESSVHQNIQFYGILLIAALSTFLLVLYNCSDQFLAIVARRLAKSREAAARRAQKTAKRWKVAKDAVNRQANGLQSKITRRYSWRMNLYGPIQNEILSQDSRWSSVTPVSSHGGNDSIELMQRTHEKEDEFGNSEDGGSQRKKKRKEKPRQSCLTATGWVIGLGTPSRPGLEAQSFIGEIWQDVRTDVQIHQDKIRLNLFSSKDLSNRRTPNIFQQYRHFLGKVGKQRLRDAQIQAVDCIIVLLAGACLGALAKGGDESFGAAGYTYTIIAVSLLCQISALRSFSQEKLQHWRESASSMSSLAYFLAKDTIDHFNMAIKSVVYLSMFYIFTNPRSNFTDNYIVLLCLVYSATGIAYALAIFFEAGAAQLWSVHLPVISTLIATRHSCSISRTIACFTYPWWALQAFIIANAERYDDVWLITRCGALATNNNWGTCLFILMFIGMLFRVITFFGMLIFQKK